MVGPELGTHYSDDNLAAIAEYEGDYESAVEHMRSRVQWLEQTGQNSFLSTAAGNLARWLCLLDRSEEAGLFGARAREVGDAHDAATQMLWRQSQALIHAHRGEHEEAEQLARAAVRLSERTDFLNMQAGARADLSTVLAAAGRKEEALTALRDSLERYERKKNVAMAAQVRPRLEALLLELHQ
jgi:tetratricopeptide (TPR) repeat protein